MNQALRTFFSFVFVGTQIGYPDCCIREFAADMALDRGHPAEMRGVTSGGWVPCWECLEEMGGA